MLKQIRHALTLIAICAGILLAAALDSAPSAYADTASDLAEARLKLEQYASSYGKIYDQVTAYTADLEVTKGNIEKNAQQIESRQSELRDAQTELSRHISDTYKAGGLSFSEVLFGSNSLNELISRIYYMNKVSESQAAAIDNIKTIKGELETARQQLSNEKRDQENLLSKAKERAAAAAAERERASSLVESLDADLKQQIADQAAKDEALAKVIDNTPSPSPTPTPDTQKSPDTPADSGGKPSPKPNPGHATGSYIENAKQFIGVPYVWGGSTPAGFDCSGLVMYAYAMEGVSLPHNSDAQCEYIKKHGRFTTDKSQLQYGDLVFFVGHVGFYAGGDSILNATQPGDVVRITRLSAQRNFIGGGQL
ncbi:NLP/P60 protein [Coriobacterium glomerans PW2]|uniref:NLP/P60 protein n=1 Tax=Coriobacterium glomerans (strain ATCC 49209 / DSM 20642 / JCM 10262 / PW2) TaxID=700015 RepID=F2N7W2_CORGP|nr:C40 family peptidase [Coriobacterium glomerans]AEB07071.1 NLP/P60 protein [Coriobacterium glomerans PW2]